MMPPKNCPKCGADMQIERIGTLRDKILKCSYCDFFTDVPDEYHEKRSEEHSGPDGSFRKVEVSFSRRDLSAEEGKHFVDDLKNRIGENGNFEKNFPSHGSDFSTSGGFSEISRMMGENLDPEMRKMMEEVHSDGMENSGSAGKSFQFTKKETSERRTVFHQPPRISYSSSFDRAREKHVLPKLLFAIVAFLLYLLLSNL